MKQLKELTMEEVIKIQMDLQVLKQKHKDELIQYCKNMYGEYWEMMYNKKFK